MAHTSSELRAPIGQAVIGGLITSALLPLFIVPVVYTILDDLSWQSVFALIRKLKALLSREEREKPALQPGAAGAEREALGE